MLHAVKYDAFVCKIAGCSEILVTPARTTEWLRNLTVVVRNLLSTVHINISSLISPANLRGKIWSKKSFETLPYNFKLPHVEEQKLHTLTEKKIRIKQLPVTIPVCNFKTVPDREIRRHQLVLIERVSRKPLVKPKGIIFCQQDIHVAIAIPVCEAKVLTIT
jgi:hypothetical protein